MSLDDYHAAKSILEDIGGDFVGPRSEALVAAAERVLGLRFPPSYRLFLSDLGCGDFNGVEIYGIISDEFMSSSAPNAIWLTLQSRQEINLSDGYIIIGDVGDGNRYAIDTRQVSDSGENPVVLLSLKGHPYEVGAPSFGAYLLSVAKIAMD
jgi:hypothetical protein